MQSILKGRFIMPNIMRKMNVVSRGESIYRTKRLGDEKIWGAMHSYILFVSNNGGCTQDRIAKALCLNKSNVTRTLSHLEDAGYVKREQSPEDKRQMLVYPTEKMLEVYPRVKKITNEWNELLTEGISEDELTVFHSVLERVYIKALKITSDGECEE